MHPDPAETSVQWRVGAALPVLKLTGAALFGPLGVLLADGDQVSVALAVLAAAVLIGWGLRDLVVRVRLAASPAGVTVISGFAGRRHLAWAEIERITVDTRPRLGLRTETLEIDTGETLYLFGRHDLGAAPSEVATILCATRDRMTAG